MAPKPSESETKDGSSSETQSAEAMEISTGDDSSLLGKRKVEATNLEDPGENEEGVDDEDLIDEEDKDSDSEKDSDSDPEWDKDSFDGREYHSSDDEREYIDKDLEKKARFYRRTVIETKGFFLATKEFPPYLWGGIATVPGLDKKMRSTGVTVRQFLANMASLCLDKYNKHKGFNVKLEHVLRANFNPGGITTYYITFAAREYVRLEKTRFIH